MSRPKKLQELLANHHDLYEELLQLFKKEDQALIWLTKTKAPLCDVTPLSLIDSAQGKEKVMDILYRIKTGDFS